MLTGCPNVILPQGQFILRSAEISICVTNGKHCSYPGEYLIISGNLLKPPVQIMKGTFEYS